MKYEITLMRFKRKQENIQKKKKEGKEERKKDRKR